MPDPDDSFVESIGSGSRERVEIEFEAARVVRRALLTEEAEGADDVASVRFRLRVSIQNRTANKVAD